MTHDSEGYYSTLNQWTARELLEVIPKCASAYEGDSTRFVHATAAKAVAVERQRPSEPSLRWHSMRAARRRR